METCLKEKSGTGPLKPRSLKSYFGGKSTIASVVWDALGCPKHYLEPFFGSGAVLLSRPSYDPQRDVETICDRDGFVACAWRALQADPDAVAKECDWPVNHADLSARKKYMCEHEKDLLEKLIADPKYYDARIAGYWIWAASCWIGNGLTSIGQRPQLGCSGNGVHAIGKIPHICGGKGVHAIGQITKSKNKKVQEPYNENIYAWFRQLSERLRHVRVVCGDWSRICGGNWHDNMGVCGFFFDPPYGVEDRDTKIYHHDSTTVAAEVMAWARLHAQKKTYRIVIAGYEEYEALEAEGWTTHHWSASSGYANLAGEESENENQNRHRECLYFSPHCLRDKELFE